MERVIRYARAADGTRIACWTLGTGQPLVYMAGGPWNHIELWELPQCRSWCERLAENRMLVRYDARGMGLSERLVPDLSLDAYLNDVEAVASELGLSRFDLFAAGDAGPVAISYAARHPERVGRIVLWCAWAKGSDFEISPRIQAWRGLIDQDWDLMSETCAHLAFGWDAGAVGRQAAEGFKATISRETAQRALAATVSADVTELLPQLEQPTLVTHRNRVSWLPVDIAAKLASSIKNSRLAIFDGETTAPYLGDSETIASMIDEFLSGSNPGSTDVTDRPGMAGVAKTDHESPGTVVSPGQRHMGVVEILPFLLRDGQILRYRNRHSDSWQTGFEPSRHPGEVARAALARADLSPVMVHSTSWRIHSDRLVLTYAAVLAPGGPVEDSCVAPVHPRELARGTATAAPEAIAIDEVVEHALRHLAWLVREDEQVREALGKNWRQALGPYVPEPFSAFDVSGALSKEDGCLLCTRFSRPLAEFVAGEDVY